MKSDGFSLIELLVVMTVIGILVGIMSIGLSEARKSSRDAQRKSNLDSIASGLELFKADCSYYPYRYSDYQTPLVPGQPLNGAECNTGANTNVYIESVPGDPLPGRTYQYDALSCADLGSGDWGNCPKYRIWAVLENPGPLDSSLCPSPPSCGTGFTCNYCVASP